MQQVQRRQQAQSGGIGQDLEGPLNGSSDFHGETSQTRVYLGIKISKAEIREMLSEFGPDFNITKRLVESRAKISPAMKRIIVQSCHLVMISDLEVDTTEENRIHEIGLALGFDQSEIDDLIASAGV